MLLTQGKKGSCPGGSPNSVGNNEHSGKALYVLSCSFILFSRSFSFSFMFFHFLSFSVIFCHFLSFSFICIDRTEMKREERRETIGQRTCSSRCLNEFQTRFWTQNRDTERRRYRLTDRHSDRLSVAFVVMFRRRMQSPFGVLQPGGPASHMQSTSGLEPCLLVHFQTALLAWTSQLGGENGTSLERKTETYKPT